MQVMEKEFNRTPMEYIKTTLDISVKLTHRIPSECDISDVTNTDHLSNTLDDTAHFEPVNDIQRTSVTLTNTITSQNINNIKKSASDVVKTSAASINNI